MKPIHITSKEARRASGGLTIVVRGQANGLYMVAAVRVQTGLPVFRPSYVEREDIAQAVGAELRMVDKCGFICPMASASRHRNYCTN